MAVLAGLLALTFVLMSAVGREFMPELEEGNLWIRGEMAVNIALPESAKVVREARAIMQHYAEVAADRLATRPA